MNISITLEQVVKSLENINVAYEMVEVDEYGFSRVFKFEILGITYYICWWSNISYLSVGSKYGNSVSFTKIAKADTHPMYKRAIAFCMKGREDFYDKFYVGLETLDWMNEG